MQLYIDYANSEEGARNALDPSLERLAPKAIEIAGITNNIGICKGRIGSD